MPYDSVLITLHGLGFSKEMVVVAISALPIAELRLAIPFALGLIPSQVYPQIIPWQHALPLAIAGNLIPVPLLLLFFGAISRLLSRIGVFKRWFQWLEERARRRGKVVERYQRIGLALFVAVPLPVTGAWTGSLVATIFGIKFKYAFLAILAGICIAGAIVTSVGLLFGNTLFGSYP
jgi:uncharacterized membrane protein